MSKRKKKKSSSRSRPQIPGTSQFARFSSAVGSSSKLVDSGGSPAAIAADGVSSAADGVSSASGISALVALSSSSDLASPDLKSQIALQSTISPPENSLVVPIGIANAAVEAVVSGPVPQEVDVGALG